MEVGFCKHLTLSFRKSVFVFSKFKRIYEIAEIGVYGTYASCTFKKNHSSTLQ